MSVDFNYGFGSAKNVLAKVKRDESKLYHAVVSQEADSISDAVFNFSVTAYHIKDWLKK